MYNDSWSRNLENMQWDEKSGSVNYGEFYIAEISLYFWFSCLTTLLANIIADLIMSVKINERKNLADIIVFWCINKWLQTSCHLKGGLWHVFLSSSSAVGN